MCQDLLSAMRVQQTLSPRNLCYRREGNDNTKSEKNRNSGMGRDASCGRCGEWRSLYGGGLSRDLDAARVKNMQREVEGGTRAFMAKGTVCVKTDKRMCSMFPEEHGGLCGRRETSKGWGRRVNQGPDHTES